MAIFYFNVLGASEGENFVQGQVGLAKVDADLLHLQDKDAKYYPCGPASFMLDMAKELSARGVTAKRIHAGSVDFRCFSSDLCSKSTRVGGFTTADADGMKACHALRVQSSDRSVTSRQMSAHFPALLVFVFPELLNGGI
jgi:hypothetical protein